MDHNIICIIVLTIVTPLFAIGSIIYSVKDKKYDEVKGAKLLQISIIVAAIIFSKLINFTWIKKLIVTKK